MPRGSAPRVNRAYRTGTPAAAAAAPTSAPGPPGAFRHPSAASHPRARSSGSSASSIRSMPYRPPLARRCRTFGAGPVAPGSLTEGDAAR